MSVASVQQVNVFSSVGGKLVDGEFGVVVGSINSSLLSTVPLVNGVLEFFGVVLECSGCECLSRKVVVDHC